MKSLLKKAREQKGFTTRQVSEHLNIDQALISKFENGQRRPTENQLLALSTMLGIDREILMVEWLKEKILDTIKDNEFGLKALQAAQHKIAPDMVSEAIPDQFQKLINEMETLKSILNEKK